MNPLKQLAGDTAIYGFSTIVARLINYLLVAYHTRVLDPAQYGIFTELYGHITFFLVILTYGMETGFFRFSSKPNQNPSVVYTTSLISLFSTSLLFFLMISVGIKSVSGWIGYPNNPLYVLQLAAVVAIDAFTAIPFARLRLLRKARIFALFKLLNVIFYVLISVLFFTFLPSYFAVNPTSFWLKFFSSTVDVGYIFTANLLSSIFTLILLLPTIFNVKISFSGALLKKMLVYSLPLLVAGLPGIANDYIDRILFRHLYPIPELALQELGVYGANVKLAVLMIIFVQMFRYAAEPFFFSQLKNEDSRIIFADVMKYFVITAMLIFLFVVLYVDIFALFMGKEFRTGIGIIPIMLIANVLLGISFNLSMWYKLSEKTNYAVYITFPGMIVTVLINILFIPRYGYYAAAWAHFFSYLFMVILSYVLGQKYYPIRYDLKSIGLYILLGIVIYAIFMVTNNFLNFTLVFKFIFATCLLACYFLVACKKDGKNIFNAFIRK
ncbi:MAG: polysaccharide biosynthesis C-terminal domain-containing protein [Prevotellaceae bacterium]|nr:polysaccharide biosynthesis C-terminal domain-containing protein [Prevotellaceae bacterium]